MSRRSAAAERAVPRADASRDVRQGGAEAAGASEILGTIDPGASMGGGGFFRIIRSRALIDVEAGSLPGTKRSVRAIRTACSGEHRRRNARSPAEIERRGPPSLIARTGPSLAKTR
jgi:hypothetical protein